MLQGMFFNLVWFLMQTDILNANPRINAIKAVQAVLEQGMSLPVALLSVKNTLNPKDKAFCQALSYGMLRFYHRYQYLLNQWMSKPINDSLIELLLISGLYQLEFMRVPPHAVVNETVNLCKKLKKLWAAKLVNAILRRWQREVESLPSNDVTYRYSHPHWLVQRIKKAWPDYWEMILSANNEKPAMQLRVNSAKITRTQYLEQLTEQTIEATIDKALPDALVLTQAVDVKQLPQFFAGFVSVQAIGAQWAAELLNVSDGMTVLDACAAPGGKTTHILTLAPQAKVTAIDIEKDRLAKVSENLERVGVTAHLIAADVAALATWHQGEQYDRILLDAPCSATGVIVRHPDIKCLRRDSDIAALAATQLQLLKTLWPLVRPGGLLLYSTCSILPEENEAVITAFLSQVDDVKIEPIEIPGGVTTLHGCQLLPGVSGVDGFYYAKLRKVSNSL